jgi:hypothetical protein
VSQNRDAVYLKHVFDEIEKIDGCVDFMSDRCRAAADSSGVRGSQAESRAKSHLCPSGSPGERSLLSTRTQAKSAHPTGRDRI